MFITSFNVNYHLRSAFSISRRDTLCLDLSDSSVSLLFVLVIIDIDASYPSYRTKIINVRNCDIRNDHLLIFTFILQRYTIAKVNRGISVKVTQVIFWVHVNLQFILTGFDEYVVARNKQFLFQFSDGISSHEVYCFVNVSNYVTQKMIL